VTRDDLAVVATSGAYGDLLGKPDLSGFLRTDGTTPLEGPWDLAQKALSQLVLASSADAPTDPVDGQLWWDGDDDRLYVYSGTDWVVVAPVDLGGFTAPDLTCSGCVDAADLSAEAMAAIIAAVTAANVGGQLPPDGLAEISNGAMTNIIDRTWDAGGLPVTIGTDAEATVEVNDPGVLRAMTVSYTVTHPYVPELEVRLFAPNDAVGIVLPAGTAGTSLTATISTTDPGGSPLYGLLGTEQQGTWTLRATDTIPSNGNEGVGNITEFRLTFEFLSGREVAIAGALGVGIVDVTELSASSRLSIPSATREAGYCDGTNQGETWRDPADDSLRVCVEKDKTQVFRSTTLLEQKYDLKHFLFVTSTSYNGNLGGLAGADAKCQERAEAGTMSSAKAPGSKWKALLSSAVDGVAAADRAEISAPVRRLGGTQLASDHADLFDGAIGTAPVLDENGAQANSPVWTGSLESGLSHGSDCTGWTTNLSSGNYGIVGWSGYADGRWLKSNVNGATCGSSNRLYCISDVVVTPYKTITDAGHSPLVCPSGTGDCLGYFAGSTGSDYDDLTFLYSSHEAPFVLESVKVYDIHCGTNYRFELAGPNGAGYFSGTDCTGQEYKATGGGTTLYRESTRIVCVETTSSSQYVMSHYGAAGECVNFSSGHTYSTQRVYDGGTGQRMYEIR